MSKRKYLFFSDSITDFMNSYFTNYTMQLVYSKCIRGLAYAIQNHDGLTLGPGPCSLRAGLAAQSGGNNLGRKVEEVSQVLDTLIGEVPVKVTPGKLLLDIPTRLQRLEEKTPYRYNKPQRGHAMQHISQGFISRMFVF